MPVARAPPAPRPSWRSFLRNRAHETGACDCLPLVDRFFRQTFVFFLSELGSRRVVHFGVTRAQTSKWVGRQLREATSDGTRPRYSIRENDSKYGMLFDRVAEGSDIEIVRAPYRAPRANALGEGFVGSVRRECLNQLLIFSDAQLYRVLNEYAEYFDQAPPYQGIGKKIPEAWWSESPPLRTGKIIAIPGRNGLQHDDQPAA